MADESLEPILDPDEDEGGPVKSFLDHLEDLRWVLIKIIATVLVSMTICLVAAPHILKVLEVPLDRSGVKITLTSFKVIGPLMSAMKISFWGGLCLSLPFILFVIGQFVFPALKKNERPYFRKAFIIGGGLFFVGVILCYWWIMPITIYGTSQFADWMGVAINQWEMQDYCEFTVMFMIGMGLSMEIPVIILTLVKMGIIPHEWMVKGRMYFFIANMVICAFITPDAISTIFMILPVQILMEICIQISAHWERQKKKAEAKARLDERDDK
jgi:sec-independent protein translocase protein TatC